MSNAEKVYKNEALEDIRVAMEEFFSYLDEILPEKRDEREEDDFIEAMNRASVSCDEGIPPF